MVFNWHLTPKSKKYYVTLKVTDRNGLNNVRMPFARYALQNNFGALVIVTDFLSRRISSWFHQEASDTMALPVNSRNVDKTTPL